MSVVHETGKERIWTRTKIQCLPSRLHEEWVERRLGPRTGADWDLRRAELERELELDWPWL